MKTIWKSFILPEESTTITAPKDAEFLCVEKQALSVVVWYSCTPQAEERTFKVYCVPTGGDVPENSKYLGTLLFARTHLVFHYFVVEASDATHS